MDRFTCTTNYNARNIIKTCRSYSGPDTFAPPTQEGRYYLAYLPSTQAPALCEQAISLQLSFQHRNSTLLE